MKRRRVGERSVGLEPGVGRIDRPRDRARRERREGEQQDRAPHPPQPHASGRRRGEGAGEKRTAGDRERHLHDDRVRDEAGAVGQLGAVGRAEADRAQRRGDRDRTAPLRRDARGRGRERRALAGAALSGRGVRGQTCGGGRRSRPAGSPQSDRARPPAASGSRRWRRRAGRDRHAVDVLRQLPLDPCSMERFLDQRRRGDYRCACRSSSCACRPWTPPPEAAVVVPCGSISARRARLIAATQLVYSASEPETVASAFARTAAL